MGYFRDTYGIIMTKPFTHWSLLLGKRLPLHRNGMIHRVKPSPFWPRLLKSIQLRFVSFTPPGGEVISQLIIVDHLIYICIYVYIYIYTPYIFYILYIIIDFIIWYHLDLLPKMPRVATQPPWIMGTIMGGLPLEIGLGIDLPQGEVQPQMQMAFHAEIPGRAWGMLRSSTA
jgi:hypothetical protein